MNRSVTEQMNSDVFDGVENATYDIKGFPEIDIKRAKEMFVYNGYKYYEGIEDDNTLTVKKKSV